MTTLYLVFLFLGGIQAVVLDFISVIYAQPFDRHDHDDHHHAQGGVVGLRENIEAKTPRLPAGF